jgi:hypothetical protein
MVALLLLSSSPSALGSIAIGTTTTAPYPGTVRVLNSLQTHNCGSARSPWAPHGSAWTGTGRLSGIVTSRGCGTTVGGWISNYGWATGEVDFDFNASVNATLARTIIVNLTITATGDRTAHFGVCRGKISASYPDYECVQQVMAQLWAEVVLFDSTSLTRASSNVWSVDATLLNDTLCRSTGCSFQTRNTANFSGTNLVSLFLNQTLRKGHAYDLEIWVGSDAVAEFDGHLGRIVGGSGGGATLDAASGSNGIRLTGVTVR